MDFIIKHTGINWQKLKPKFLRNPQTNCLLELDIYNAYLKIAFEYQGIQHYKFMKFWHRTFRGFINQVKRDKIKKKLCKENGVILIEIPYTLKGMALDKFIMESLIKHNIPLVQKSA